MTLLRRLGDEVDRRWPLDRAVRLLTRRRPLLSPLEGIRAFRFGSLADNATPGSDLVGIPIARLGAQTVPPDGSLMSRGGLAR